MKKILILIIILLIAGAGFIFFKNTKHAESDNEILLSGNVEVTEINPGFKMAGRITGLFTDEGMMVDAGQKIAALDDAQVKDIVDQNQAKLREAVASLENLNAGSREQEIARASALAKSANADFVKAKKDYERAAFLFKNGAISAQDNDAAKRSYDGAAAQYKAAVENANLVQAGFRKDDIKAASFRVEGAQAALAEAKEKLNDTILYAPCKAVVLNKNLEAGDIVAAGVPVFTLGDLNRPWVKVYIKETKFKLIKLGQKAQVTADGFPDKIYPGYVSYIASQAEFTPKNIQTKEERVKLVFEVKVMVENKDGDLKPGMPADVKIILK